MFIFSYLFTGENVKKSYETCLSSIYWKTAPVQSFEAPATPSGLTGTFTFYVTESKWIFLSPGPKWVVNSPPSNDMSYTHTVLPFLTMDDKWYDDNREKTRSYRNNYISSMEMENDEHLNTLQLEVTKWEITKNYKSSFTVFWSFCRMTQSIQSVFLVVISRIQQITAA